MKINDDTTIVIGPPGTGKTGELIRRAIQAIECGCNPQYIGYISFTRQAVKEARDRIMAATGESEDSFTGFKTLHALLYWLLNLQKGSILNPYDALEMSSILPTTVEALSQERARLYAHIYNYSRIMGISLAKAWELLYTEYCGTEVDFLSWVKAYKQLKSVSHKVDFIDMVEEFISQNIYFPFTYLFIDEAQDFTPDQWDGILMLAKHAQHVIVAGDPDQSLFAWAGATGHRMTQLEGETVVLSQSHRVPRGAHRLARRILRDMGRKILYKPADREGQLHWISAPEMQQLPFNNGETWFILTRNRAYLKSMQGLLYNMGIYYEELGAKKFEQRHKDIHVRRIEWYEQLVAGKEPYHKNKIRKELSSIVFNLDECIAKKTPWQKAFVGWPINRIEFYHRTRSQWDNPKVFIGTFHSAKGAEADNVVLYGNCFKRVQQAHYRESIEELQATYVAVTRTKNRLFLVQSTEYGGIPWYKWMNPEYIKRSPENTSAQS